jgi:hypothetical protein
MVYVKIQIGLARAGKAADWQANCLSEMDKLKSDYLRGAGPLVDRHRWKGHYANPRPATGSPMTLGR